MLFLFESPVKSRFLKYKTGSRFDTTCVQREVDVCNNTDSTCCAKMIPPLWQAAPSDRTYQRRKTQVIHENDY